jgi:hypothetical protein
MAERPASCLSKDGEISLISLFEADLAHDRGEAALLHLQAERPIHYVEESTPDGHVIRERPNGDRELLRVDDDGSTHVIGAV